MNTSEAALVFRLPDTGIGSGRLMADNDADLFVGLMAFVRELHWRGGRVFSLDVRREDGSVSSLDEAGYYGTGKEKLS